MLFSAANFKKMEAQVKERDTLIEDIEAMVIAFKSKNYIGMVISLVKFIADLMDRIKQFKNRQSADIVTMNVPMTIKKQ